MCVRVRACVHVRACACTCACVGGRSGGRECGCVGIYNKSSMLTCVCDLHVAVYDVTDIDCNPDCIGRDVPDKLNFMFQSWVISMYVDPPLRVFG